MSCPGAEVFRAAGDFPDHLVRVHNNMQEACGLQQVHTLFCKDRPWQVHGTTVVVDVDNTVLFHSTRRGRAKDVIMHAIISDLFWLQVRLDFYPEIAVGVLRGEQRSRRFIPAGSRPVC